MKKVNINKFIQCDLIVYELRANSMYITYTDRCNTKKKQLMSQLCSSFLFICHENSFFKCNNFIICTW